MLVPFDNTPAQSRLLADIYTESFPPEERRPTDHFFRLADTPGAPFRILVICDDAGHYAGFISYWQFDTFAYIEHFAVNPAARGGGIGACALQEFRAMSGLPVVLEVERPGSNDMADRRIAFYRRNGFHTIELRLYTAAIRTRTARGAAAADVRPPRPDRPCPCRRHIARRSLRLYEIFLLIL